MRFSRIRIRLLAGALIFTGLTGGVVAAPVLVAGDGTVIGVVVDLSRALPLGGPAGELEGRVTVVSAQGYAFGIDLQQGMPVAMATIGDQVQDTLYADDACTDPPVGPVGRALTYKIRGALFYTPIDATAETISYGSRIVPAGLGGGAFQCVAQTGTFSGLPLLANDPEVTGMPNGAVATPLRIEQRESCLFDDPDVCVP